MTGLIVDLFAGGGGASVGIEAALGRPVDLAVNHDPVALAVHAANHPTTTHLTSDIWEVRPKEATWGKRVRFLWASPDCTHFSVAKGGKPRKQNIRSLAWVVCRWAKAVRPDVIGLENVSEFQGWGPLDKEGKPITLRKGETFQRWKRQLERLGYVVDYRILNASHYGAPTSRKRLILIARCDGKPIVWPERTHGPGLLPYRTAAECIDWSIPCPSIFDRKKPLAEKTLWRIAQGIKRFVIENPRPFIVGVGGRAGQSAPTGADDPVGTVTAKNDRALVIPQIVKVNHGGMTDRSEDPAAPMTTITAARRGHALVVPVISRGQHGGASTSADAPIHTITASPKDTNQILAASLVQTGYGEREGQQARVLDIEKPHGTVVAGGGKSALVAAVLAKAYGDREGKQVNSQPIDLPVPPVTTKDHNQITVAHLAKLRGECHSASAENPAPTLTSGGTHVAEVRAFLTAYYGCEKAGQSLADPVRTVTTKDRLGLVVIEGTEYQITDIGMRMLEPHELLAAQFGRFAPTYDMSAAGTKTAKVRLIGNSVCPELAEAVVKAQFSGTPARQGSLFDSALPPLDDVLDPFEEYDDWDDSDDEAVA